MLYEPVRIVEEIAEDVGAPRDDNSRGSALYPVPVRLSRSLNHDEARYLEQLWDRPPQYTTMHRPGIARVSGDRLTLDGTTIDEVENYHAETLRQMMPVFNEAARSAYERSEAAEAAERGAEAAHRDHVDEVADRITFGDP